VLTDQVMPTPTGTELLSAIRRARPGANILLTTAMIDSVSARTLEQLGCEILPKPVSAAELGEAVARGLGGARSA
jgi:DNA-binding NtrC family response regulator